MQALAADKAAAAHEREMEVARLRALQEQVQDTRSAEDELRAKRYQVSTASLSLIEKLGLAGFQPGCERYLFVPGVFESWHAMTV